MGQAPSVRRAIPSQRLRRVEAPALPPRLPLQPRHPPPKDSRPTTQPDHSLSTNPYRTIPQFEERAKEGYRARVIYKYALEQLPKSQAQDLYKKYVLFEKQHGDRSGSAWPTPRRAALPAPPFTRAALYPCRPFPSPAALAW